MPCPFSWPRFAAWSVRLASGSLQRLANALESAERGQHLHLVVRQVADDDVRIAHRLERTEPLDDLLDGAGDERGGIEAAIPPGDHRAGRRLHVGPGLPD